MKAPGTFWSATNDPTTESSALSYTPEIVWNESGNVTGGSGLFATGGGASTVYTKPAFQAGPGVPADGARDIPDVSLSSASHDGYLIIQEHTSTASGLVAVGGTSAASPSFAGLMALVVQKTGAAQGNANPVLYAMGQNQVAGGIAVYHDITSGDNSVPGVPGSTAGSGYDAATGWGSVDATNFVTLWNNNATPDFALSASPASQSVNQGVTADFTVTLTAIGGYASSVHVQYQWSSHGCHSDIYACLADWIGQFGLGHHHRPHHSGRKLSFDDYGQRWRSEPYRLHHPGGNDS